MRDDNSSDAKSPFGEKTIVQSSVREDKSAANADRHSQNNEKTMVYAKSNLQEHFDARTVVRSSKPAPAHLPDEAPPAMSVIAQAKVIPADVPPPPATAAAFVDASEEFDLEKPSALSKTARRQARAALDRKTRKYMMGFGIICIFAIAVFVVSFTAKPSDKSAVAAGSKTGSAPRFEDASSIDQKTELASEGGSAAVPSDNGRSPGSYKTTTDVLKDFDRAAKRAQDHSVGF